MKIKKLLLPLVSLLLVSCGSSPDVTTGSIPLSTSTNVPTSTTPTTPSTSTAPPITSSTIPTTTPIQPSTNPDSFIKTTLEDLSSSPGLRINYSFNATITLILDDCIYVQSGSNAAKINFEGGTSSLNLINGSMVTLYALIPSLSTDVLTLTSIKAPDLVSPNGDTINYADLLHSDFDKSKIAKKVYGSRVRLRGVFLKNSSAVQGSYVRYQASFLQSKDLTVLLSNELLDTATDESTAYVITGILEVNPNDPSKLELVADIKLSESATMLSVGEARDIVTWTESNKFTEEEYYVYGNIDGVLGFQSDGSANFTVNYNDKSIYAYKLKNIGNTDFDSANEKLESGDFVILKGLLGYHSSAGIEIKTGHIYDHNAVISSGGGGGGENSGDPSEGIITVNNRRHPVKATGETGYIYGETGTIVKTLTKGTYYTSIADVAGYVSAFRELPANYYIIDRDVDRSPYNASKKLCFENYGTSCRLSPNYYESNYTYLPWPTDKRYLEVDIGSSTYATSSSWNRGAYRLLVNFDGLSEYNNDGPIIFYTPDHYSNFREYSNYYSSWGSSFGESGGSWQALQTIN